MSKTQSNRHCRASRTPRPTPIAIRIGPRLRPRPARKRKQSACPFGPTPTGKRRACTMHGRTAGRSSARTKPARGSAERPPAPARGQPFGHSAPCFGIRLSLIARPLRSISPRRLRREPFAQFRRTVSLWGLVCDFGCGRTCALTVRHLCGAPLRQIIRRNAPVVSIVPFCFQLKGLYRSKDRPTGYTRRLCGLCGRHVRRTMCAHCVHRTPAARARNSASRLILRPFPQSWLDRQASQ